VGGGTSGAGGASGAGSATIAVTQPPGSILQITSDTTPCVIAGLTMSNSSACAPSAAAPAAGASGGSGGGSAPPASGAATPLTPPKPPTMAAMPVATGSTEGTLSDLLVFSDANPGDDAQVEERERILAQLDLPRPEMVINAWVMQNSTTDPRAMGAFSDTLRDLVNRYNGALEELILQAWEFVGTQTQSPDYFNENFYHYVTDRYVAAADVSGPPPTTAQDAAQRFLESSRTSMADSEETRTRDFGICEDKRYCLGYSGLFQPLKPHLTDILLTLIAADHPVDSTQATIRSAEGGEGSRLPVTSLRVCESAERESERALSARPRETRKFDPRELKERCQRIWENLELDRAANLHDCTLDDYQYILGSIVRVRQPIEPAGHSRIYLACFGQEVSLYLKHVGLLRAALADFLFNYKQSQQYPHEFIAYDLSQSADALNAALSPLVEAFNRDVMAFQTFMRADVQYQVDRLNSTTDQRCCAKRLFGLDKPSFFNDGLISVRTISLQPTVVNTASQSALDASAAPTLANLANSIISPPSSAATNASPVAAVLGSGGQPAASLLAGVLNAYQATTVQIGRQLNLQVTPRSLTTASSAELNVTLNADESGSPAFYGGPSGATQPNMSRVASHDTTTRVRVESIKLFELSTFSAVLERSRSRFPLLPPFVEIPYIGTFAGIPIPGAREYHASSAVISATVLPTAADIAYGLRFTFDRVLDGDPGSCSIIGGSAGLQVTKPCRFRRAVALNDFGDAPIREFHKAMINCLATDMKAPYSSSGSLTHPPAGACDHISFDRVLHDAY
jgi:hypothetical protein